MSRLIRTFSAAVLCLALALGGMAMVVARAQASAVARDGITMVICSGYGVLTVTLDENGTPVGPVHPCPECLAGMSAYLGPATPARPRIALRWSVVSAIDPPELRNAQERLASRARGPPVRG